MMRELVLHCAQADAEAISDALLAAGALSVAVEDAQRDSADEAPLFGEPGTEPEVQAWAHNRIVALLGDQTQAHSLITTLHAAGLLPPDTAWQERSVADTDWVRLTQSQFGPIQVGERIWITPSWHEDDARIAQALDAAPANSVRIRLDPGLAFGTGSHPTTHLCLEWLEQHLKPGSHVLDYGCGSGILAIAARLLGAGPTTAVDIDAQAVESTRDNAQRNHVDVCAILPDALTPGTFDLVLANILSNPLKLLAPMLAQRVAACGHLVLAGVLARQTEDLIAAYAPWLSLQAWRVREDWVCLHGQRHV